MNHPTQSARAEAENRSCEHQCMEQLKAAIWVFDIDQSKVVWANPAAVAVWHSKSLEELQSRDMAHDMSVSVSKQLTQYQQDFNEENVEFSEVWTLYPRGEPQTYRVLFRGFRFDDGSMGMMCEALSEEKATPEKIRSSEALIHTSIQISLFDERGQPLYVNPAARECYNSSTVLLADRFVEAKDYKKLLDQLASSGEYKMICRMRTFKGMRWHEITARACTDAVSGETAHLLSEVDISDLKKREDEIRHLADHDVLTGLPNRTYMQRIFPQRIAAAKVSGSELAFILLDLDRFKSINDAFGHAAGDELLIQVAQRLLGTVGPEDNVVRLGGDEFIICMQVKNGVTGIEAQCQSILDALTTDFMIFGQAHNIRGSIGVSLYPGDGSSMSKLMRYADFALYDAKDAGKDTFRFFTRSLRDRLERQLFLENELERASRRQEFILHYQPRVCMKTNAVVGVEALIRWQHPEKGLIPPDKFIPVLEDTGLINEVGKWLVSEVSKAQMRLASLGFDISFSLNVSPRQFNAENFFELIMGEVKAAGCDPEKLEIEITESMLMRDEDDPAGILNRLRKAGFGIAIDDFGTGYSNLAYLQDYPITSLKIDKSFIDSIEKNAAVVNLVLSLCRIIGIKSVAEGVETKAQLDWLVEAECDEYQGYLFSRPVAFDDLLSLLQRQTQPEGKLIRFPKTRRRLR